MNINNYLNALRQYSKVAGMTTPEILNYYLLDNIQIFSSDVA